MRKEYLSIIAVLLLVLLSANFYIRNDIRFTPDSGVYVGVADQIAEGNGFMIPFGQEKPNPLLLAAPFYPLVLAGISSFFGVQAIYTAKILNIWLYIINAFLALLFIYKTTKSSFYSVIATTLLIISPAYIILNTMVWTEPVFIFLTFTGLYLLASGRIILSLPFIAFAMTTRYAGVALLPATTCLLLFNQSKRVNVRIKEALVYSVTAFIPLASWFIRNEIVSGSVEPRVISLHFPGSEHLSQIQQSVTLWLPIAILILISFSLLPIRRNVSLSNLEKLLLLYGLFQIIVVVFTVLFYDMVVSFDFRTLAPTYFAFFIVSTGLLFKLSSQMAAGSIVIIILAISLFLVNVPVVGGSPREWSGAKILENSLDLPEDLTLYSNYPERLYILTGQSAKFLPSKYDPKSLKENRHYLLEMETIDHNSAIVYFDNARAGIPTIEEIEKYDFMCEKSIGGYICR
jgi:hypothetical protein